VEPIRVIRDEQGRVVESIRNEVEDTFFAHLKFGNGAVGELFGGFAGHGESVQVKGGLAIYGTRGVIKGPELLLDGGERFVGSDLFAREASSERKERWFPRGIRDGFALELLDFLQAIERGGRMETDGDEGVRDL